MSISSTIEPEPTDEPEVPKTEDPTEVVQETPTPATTPTTSSTTPTPTSPPKSQADQITDALMGLITPVGQKSHLKLMLYGPPGGTKSSFLSGADNQLIFDQEGGLISIKTQETHSGRPAKKNIRSIPFKGFGAADELVSRLEAKIDQLKWVEVFSIDTLNDFHRKALAERIERNHAQMPNSVDPFLAETEDHVANNERMLRFIRRLRDLDMDIIILAHSKTVEPKNKPSKTYPDFSESLANKIEAMMDIVGYMEMQEIDGKAVPVVRFVSDGVTHAKTRIPLPEVVRDPTWDQIKAVWDKWMNEEN